MATNLIIADDHALFRQGLRSLLLLQPDMIVAAEVESADKLPGVLAQNPCDILLLDLQMDRWTMDDIPSLAQKTAIIVLTASESVENGMAALRLGARALVQKRFAIETLMTAIQAVLEGNVWMPPSLQAAFTQQDPASRKRLTRRESEIIRCVAMGMRNAEVAEQLSLSENTVKTHLTNIFQKLGIRDRLGLTHYAIKRGLVSVRDR
ncbi:MAG TPA: response regulator transcription factor [Candidatus Binataceae bacterium]|nr:response regulator transcription factor [Candidatus Binataceae bacterium]